MYIVCVYLYLFLTAGCTSMCCSIPTLGQENKTHTFKEGEERKGLGVGRRRRREKRKVRERGHLFCFRAPSGCSKTYLFPGLSCLDETVFPVVIAKSFAVGQFGANTHMRCHDPCPSLSSLSEEGGQSFLLLTGC